jgi:hypothetical protein
MARPFSVYEQQALEACPCPHCGAYTLSCDPLAEQPAVTESSTAGEILSPRRAA